MTITRYRREHVCGARLSKKQLAGNVRKMRSDHMKALVRIFYSSRTRYALDKWRSMAMSRVDHFYFRYKTSLRYTFLMWKSYARSRRLIFRSKRQGCVILGCVLWRANDARVKQALRRWKEAVRGLRLLLRRTFDEWSLRTLQRKLLKCNILKTFKTLSARRAARSHKRIRWYFEHWRETADKIARLEALRTCFDR